MNRLEELEILIEDLKHKLRNYLDEERSEDEIYKLSTQIDGLIVEYHRLVQS